jgi:hypothetical protein
MGDGTSALLIDVLAVRFHANMVRHSGLAWEAVAARLAANPSALTALAAMEKTGGEPDVVMLPGIRPGADAQDAIMFADCAAESPAGRRSLCFDEAAHASRKENKPAGSVEGLAASMGAALLDENQYRALQQLGAFDRKTSSWIKTPANIRAFGGALFCDRRYDVVFTYHNGAESYYAARGFRCLLAV